MYKRLLTSLLFFPLYAFNELPWTYELWECYFNPSYTYQTYKAIKNSNQKENKSFHNHLLNLDFSILFLPAWELSSVIELSGKHVEFMRLRSLGLQIRYVWLNDILGEPLSLVTGLNIRHVSSKSLKNPNCPYHQKNNIEILITLGKEWSEAFEWKTRIYSLAALGIANSGSPWIRLKAALEKNIHDIHSYGISIEGCAGFGHEHFIHIDHFNGYASINHQNIDMGVYYTYTFPIFGQLSIFYYYRLYAKYFPEKMQTMILEYQLPFSFF